MFEKINEIQNYQTKYCLPGSNDVFFNDYLDLRIDYLHIKISLRNKY